MLRDNEWFRTGGPDGHVAARSRRRLLGLDARYQPPGNATWANVGRVGGAPRKIGSFNGDHATE